MFKIIQLNCHNSFDVTLSALNTESNSSILILQEPWINPHTLNLPIHSNWLCLLDHNHSPSSYQDKHRNCFLINKKYNSEQIHPLPGGSRILSAVDIDININKIQSIRLINVYNPSKHFEALRKLDIWLNHFNDRKIPSFIFIDSNLHNKLWNPSNYPHSHCKSKNLIKTCGQQGFKIISEKGTPTFPTRRSSPTTIDLTWVNFLSQKLVHSCINSSENHGSNHQAIHLTLSFQSNIQINDRLSCDLEKINIDRFKLDLTNFLRKLPTHPQDIDVFVEKLTISLQNSIYNRDGRAASGYPFGFGYPLTISAELDIRIRIRIRWWIPASEKSLKVFLQKESLTGQKPITFLLKATLVEEQVAAQMTQTSSSPRGSARNASHPIKQLIDSEISNTPSSHPSPIHNILGKHLINDYDLSSIETIHPHIIDPWEDFSLPIANLNVKKEDIKTKVQSQIDQSKSNSEHLIFTDGSNIPENGAGSAAILNNSTQFSCQINNSEKSSAFKAEVQAIKIGLDIFINQHLSPSSSTISSSPINFFVDNQATL
ncbi:hypothetical protein PGT21_026545 [Puccinia graminis f. sp. tritici]|uniref:Endonuclease/exonuclease/phosphatase domain-containing protein n=1 Tax=Puccinia graminis f. sp. tritici TaxID=56615 RepID=A0A5B0LP11_PUCGR|nr:hypothetical protein PGT21_026545 [Puccinia graminis f. sp. tritici]